jgi:diaminopimelate epimerase
MKLRFTKMQGAGNDFVVLDATRVPLALSAQQLRALGDRRFGVGADQILVVEKSSTPGIDFRYRIFNGGSGDEVEQCGNGARCFVRYVRDKKLSDKDTLRVETMNTQLELRLQADGRVTVDMGAPVFDLPQLPFDATGLTPKEVNGFALWPIDIAGQTVHIAAVSMGNPHAVQVVADVEAAPVESQGPLIEAHTRFPRKVNAGFLQIVNRGQVKLRVYERGAGETLSCGTGACAAVVAGIRQGLLDATVDVDTHGGQLTIQWSTDDPSVAENRDRSPEGIAPGLGRPGARAAGHVLMTGPAETVFEGEIDV